MVDNLIDNSDQFRLQALRRAHFHSGTFKVVFANHCNECISVDGKDVGDICILPAYGVNIEDFFK